MEKKPFYIVSPLTCLLVSVLSAPHAYAAANFNISPTAGKAFPTSIQAGSSVSAFYTITNNTRTTRNGYTIKGLPASVTINQSGSTCTYPVTLAGRSSCMMQLDISNPVQTGFALCRQNTCTSAAVPLNVVAASSVSIPLVAAGGYTTTTTGSSVFPLLAASTDNGATWSYKITGSQPTYPPTFNFAGPRSVFGASACNGKTCIAAGGYIITPPNAYPLFATSTDGAKTWQYTLTANSTLPPDFASLRPNNGAGASCSTESNCIAVSTYTDTINSYDYAVVAYSSDKGQHWTFPIDSQKTPTDYNGNSVFTSATCSGKFCVAGGFYTVGTDYGLIATSSNYGASWNYTLDSNQIPTDFQGDYQLRSVSCSGSLCVAGGYYTANTGTPIQFPVIATSTNGGATWSYTLDSSKTMPSGFQDNGIINSVNCKGTQCVAVGTYTTATQTVPFAAVSSNGMSWTYTLDATNLPANFFITQSNQYTVSCSGTTCVLAGAYRTTAAAHPSYPLIATSNNGGNSWTYTLDSSKTMPSGYVTDPLQLSQVSCNGQTCIVSGFYATSTVLDSPIVIQSTDGGKTWTYPVNLNAPQLPANIEFGMFSNASAGTSNFLPDYLKDLFML